MGAGLLRVWLLAVALPVCSTLVAAQTRPQKADPCEGSSNMTQAQLNECAAKDLQKTELRMEKLLKQLGIALDSPEQKAWEAYRDAQLVAIYPPKEISSFGSVYPMCLAMLRKALTEGRIRDLKALTTTGVGDVCSGFRPSRN